MVRIVICVACTRTHPQGLRAPHDATLAVIDYTEGFYNTHRRHSGPGYHSPINHEEINGLQQAA